MVYSSYFTSIGILPYFRDDIESFFITIMFLTNKSDGIFKNIFELKDLYFHRLFKLSLNKYGIINYLRSKPSNNPIQFTIEPTPNCVNCSS